MPKMGVNPEKTKAEKPVPAAWYDVKIKSFTSKVSASKKGINYVAIGEVVNNTAENNGKGVFVQINNGFTQAKVANDFVHSLGFTLETDGSFPGKWTYKNPNAELDADGNFKDIMENDGAQYSGPMLGKVSRMELAVDVYNGEERNVVKQFQCKVPDCATRFPDIRHLTDIRGKKAA